MMVCGLSLVTETQQMFALIPGMKLGGGKVEANVKGFYIGAYPDEDA